MTNNIDEQARNWAMLCHLSALSVLIIPFGNIIGPLIIWLIKKDEYPFVDEHGKESLNFQISLTIYILISIILILVIIGILFLIGLTVAGLIFVIIATIKANAGEHYEYPFTIKFL